MATKPEASINQVPGSGTTPADPLPQAPDVDVFPLPPASISISPLPFFLTGEQTLSGNGGEEKDTQPPPTNGSYKPIGPAAPRPVSGRFSKADSNATGGACIAVPSPARSGSSNFCTGGSTGEAACSCGACSTRLAQRVRAVILPSVVRVSPL